MLERQIAAQSQTVTLRREVANAALIEVEVKAVVRGYRPDELVGGIMQGDSIVVLSPRELAATGFPGLPRNNDGFLVAGRRRNVMMVDPVSIGDETVRINVQVRG